MSIASVAWNAMHLYGLAGCSHNACKLPKKLLTPENDRRKSSATKTLRANSALVYNYVTASAPPHVASHSTFEHKLCATHHFGWVHSPAVASLGIDGEGGVLADGVGVVVVVTFPGVVVVVEDEVPSEEEDLRSHLAALAHPLSM